VEHNPRRKPIFSGKNPGYLGRQWSDWFGCLTITLEDNGVTLLTGPVVDQAVLDGLLNTDHTVQMISPQN
jgi:hypothetical protein